MNKKILVIDDNPDVCQIVKEIFERNNFAVLVAPSGKEGLKVARRHRPDLVFLDIAMEDMDGFAVLKALKESDRTIMIPVIILTGRDSAECKQAMAQRYCEDYLVKPVNPELILSKANEVLARWA